MTSILEIAVTGPVNHRRAFENGLRGTSQIHSPAHRALTNGHIVEMTRFDPIEVFPAQNQYLQLAGIDHLICIPSSTRSETRWRLIGGFGWPKIRDISLGELEDFCRLIDAVADPVSRNIGPANLGPLE